MAYRVLADLVLALHLAFIVWVCLGWLAVRFRRWAAWLHAPAALWGAAIEFANWPCPLTPLENQLRQWAGQQGYAGGFIEHYLVAVIYPNGLDRGAQVVLGLAVLLANACGYWWALSRRPRRGGAPSKD